MFGHQHTATPSELGLLMLLGVLWGIPYALTKIALESIPPITLVATRVLLAAAVLWIVVFVRGCKLPPREVLPRLFVQACVACVIPYTFIAYGQQSVDSALTAILNSTVPLFVCLISLIGMRHEALTVARLSGVVIGLGGVVLIAGASALAGLGQGPAGQLAIIVATLSSAVSAIHGRRFADIAPEVAAAVTLTWAAVLLIPFSLIFEAPLNATPSAASLIALLVNAVVATALGFVLYFRLIRTIGSMSTASVGYLKPAIGVLIGCTWMGESLTWTSLAGLMLILSGVAGINQTASLWGRLSIAPKLRAAPSSIQKEPIRQGRPAKQNV